ncbi:TraR/DksA family transcriptional regulator [Alteromonadaceae bacterium 2753L.S.0a.02]|nr:TraR/DksA family transcriptional regulator [Alteromonadaceae bacterium 2753L.S.0a.02]
MKKMNIDALQLAIRQELEKLTALKDISTEGADTVELDQSKVGRLSRMDAMQQQAMQVEQNRRRKLRIQQLQAALLRVEKDDYGWCLDCGEAINPKRLEVDPAAFYCTGCADKH